MTLHERIYDVLEHELGRNAADFTNARLREDLGAADYDISSIKLGLEDEFGIQISDIDMSDLTTVRKLVHYISSRVSTAA